MALTRLRRTMTVDLTAADDHTVTGVVVPYNEPADVCDDYGPTPVYREVFTPASFAGQMQGVAAGRPVSGITLNIDHRPELDYLIGNAVALRSTDAGLVATFDLYPSRDIDKVLAMLTRSHTGLSIEAGAGRSRTWADGTVERLQCTLFAAAATTTPAYAGAGITAVRADQYPEPAPLPTPHADAAAAAWGWT